MNFCLMCLNLEESQNKPKAVELFLLNYSQAASTSSFTNIMEEFRGQALLTNQPKFQLLE